LSVLRAALLPAPCASSVRTAELRAALSCLGATLLLAPSATSMRLAEFRIPPRTACACGGTRRFLSSVGERSSAQQRARPPSPPGGRGAGATGKYPHAPPSAPSAGLGYRSLQSTARVGSRRALHPGPRVAPKSPPPQSPCRPARRPAACGFQCWFEGGHGGKRRPGRGVDGGGARRKTRTHPCPAHPQARAAPPARSQGGQRKGGQRKGVNASAGAHSRVEAASRPASHETRCARDPVVPGFANFVLLPAAFLDAQAPALASGSGAGL